MIWIGTSGYNYPEWKGSFYPRDLAAAKMLPYYAARFPTVEINYTFYRMPNEKIVNTDLFDDPNLPGQMITTISLKAVSCGTELTAVQEGIPEATPVEMCYLGWQETLALLAQLVEPEIPG